MLWPVLRPVLWLVLWPVLCVLSACADAPAVPADPLPLGDAPYAHTPSGLVFPAMVDHFRRLDVFRQDPAGQSVSVGYALEDPTGSLTAIVHVYPARIAAGSLALFDATANATSERSAPEIAALRRELVRLHPALRVEAQEDAFLVQDGAEQSGRELVVSFDDAATARPEPTVVDAYAFCCRARDRAVVYRFQYPQAIADAARTEVAAFMRDLPWAASPPDAAPHRQAPAMPH